MSWGLVSDFFSIISRPDMTFAVDWVLNNNDLSIYLHHHQAAKKTTMSRSRSRSMYTAPQQATQGQVVLDLRQVHLDVLGAGV